MQITLFATLLSSLTGCAFASDFITEFNELVPGANIDSSHIYDNSRNGFIAMEDRPLYRKKSVTDKWYKLMETGEIDALMLKYYPDTPKLAFVPDVKEFASKADNFGYRKLEYEPIAGEDLL